jgi:hypothetical protein
MPNSAHMRHTGIAHGESIRSLIFPIFPFRLHHVKAGYSYTVYQWHEADTKLRIREDYNPRKVFITTHCSGSLGPTLPKPTVLEPSLQTLCGNATLTLSVAVRGRMSK